MMRQEEEEYYIEKLKEVIDLVIPDEQLHAIARKYFSESLNDLLLERRKNYEYEIQIGKTIKRQFEKLQNIHHITGGINDSPVAQGI